MKINANRVAGHGGGAAVGPAPKAGLDRPDARGPHLQLPTRRAPVVGEARPVIEFLKRPAPPPISIGDHHHELLFAGLA